MNKLLVTIDGQEFEVEVSGPPGDDGFATVLVNGEPLRVALRFGQPPEAINWALVETRPYELQLDRELRWLQSPQGRHSLHVRDLEAGVVRPISRDGRIKAPIPGIIRRILVQPGQPVELGQPVLVLEAMKMENEIVAPRAGTVGPLNVQPGQTVVLNELLVEIR
ncbi:MAG: biotin/lipoyl-containing protein [Oscillochloridaceae bacterium umkhey_bin13]